VRSASELAARKDIATSGRETAVGDRPGRGEQQCQFARRSAPAPPHHDPGPAAIESCAPLPFPDQFRRPGSATAVIRPLSTITARALNGQGSFETCHRNRRKVTSRREKRWRALDQEARLGGPPPPYGEDTAPRSEGPESRATNPRLERVPALSDGSQGLGVRIGQQKRP